MPVMTPTYNDNRTPVEEECLYAERRRITEQVRTNSYQFTLLNAALMATVAHRHEQVKAIVTKGRSLHISVKHHTGTVALHNNGGSAIPTTTGR